MKSLYVSATKRDTGKTTLMIGLMRSVRDLGHDAGYLKPVGQRYIRYEGSNVDEDAVLARLACDMTDDPADMSPVAIEPGFTERYIFNRDPEPLERRILEAYGRLRAQHDLLMIEGTGHAGVGSCFDLSNARVARLLGACVAIVTGGGIGSAIDEAALSLHLFRKHGVEVLGVILNKVWPEKLAKVKRVVAQGLSNLGTRLLGAVPFQPQLVHPAVEQILSELRGRLLCGEQVLDNRVEHTVVAAMSPEHVGAYLQPRTLVITPGDRLDTVDFLVSTIRNPSQRNIPTSVSCIVLTGGFLLPKVLLTFFETARVPVILCEEDTFTVAAQLRDLVFKIRPNDTGKIARAHALVREHIDVPGLVARLAE